MAHDVHVPHYTAGVSLLRIASYLPFFPTFCSPFLIRPPSQQRAPRSREFSSTCLDAKHSHSWSDDTNTCIHKRRAQQFTGNTHGGLASHWAAKEKIYFGDTLNALRGSCCFRLRNWNGAAVISWSLLSWTSCLTACHRGIDLLWLSAALHGKWYLTAGKALHLSRWVKKIQKSFILEKKGKKKNPGVLQL